VSKIKSWTLEKDSKSIKELVMTDDEIDGIFSEDDREKARFWRYFVVDTQQIYLKSGKLGMGVILFSS
jgi:hypothetical protein